MLRIAAVVAAIAVSATAVYANADAIKARKAIFKEMGGAAKGPGAMMKGEAKFELAKVHAALNVYANNAQKVKAHFPAGSDQGDTTLLPKALKESKQFMAGFDKLTADAKAAVSKIKDEASFKAEYPKVMANCGTCHKAYRKPKN